MTFEEDYTTILKNGRWTRHGSCPIIIEEWESEGETPDEGIRLINDDVDTEEGSDCYGKIHYEKEGGTITTWANNKQDRENIRLDIIDIINVSGDNAIISGYLPITFMEKKGFEMRIRRIV